MYYHKSIQVMFIPEARILGSHLTILPTAAVYPITGNLKLLSIT